MDEQMAYAMERWRQMMNAQAGVKVGPDTSMYRGMVDNIRLQNPNMMLPPTDLIMRQMQYESQMNPRAIAPGPAGDEARGLMKVKPGTALDLQRKGLAQTGADFYDPESNIKLGTAYLDYLKRRYGGAWEETLQRYNLGPSGYDKGGRVPGYLDEVMGTHDMTKIFDPEGKGYDEKVGSRLARRYPLTIPKPEKYQGDYVTEDGAFQAWVWHPEKDDYVKHSGSLDPATGMVLKGRLHPTWGLMEEEEKKRGSRIVRRNGRYYSVPASKRKGG